MLTKQRIVSGINVVPWPCLRSNSLSRVIHASATSGGPPKIGELSEFEAMKKQLAEAQAELSEKEAILLQKDAKLSEKDAKLLEKDAKLSEKDAKLLEKDAKLLEKDAKLLEKDAEVDHLKALSSAAFVEWANLRRPAGKRAAQSTFGFVFPFVNRHTAQRALKDVAQQHIVHRGDGDRVHHPIPVCLGAPGTGKTRLLREHHDIIQGVLEEHKKHAVRLIVSFGNGTKFTPSEREGGETALARRVAERYFGAELPSSVKQLRLPVVLKAIVECERREKGIEGDVALVLGIDEMQVLGDHQQGVVDALQCALLEPPAGMDVFPFLAGTNNVGVRLTITSGSSHTCVAVEPRLLSEENAVEIAAGMGLPTEEPAVRRALASCGGLPRAIEYTVAMLRGRVQAEDQWEMGAIMAEMDTVSHALLHRYPRVRALPLKLLRSCFDGELVRRDDSPGSSGATYEDLQRDGALILDGEDLGSAHVRLPPIFLRSVLRTMKDEPVLTSAMRALLAWEPRGEVDDKDWEMVMAQVLHYHVMSRVHDGVVEATVQDLMPGVIFSDGAVPVQLPAKALLERRENTLPCGLDWQFPKTRGGALEELLHSGRVVHNGRGAPGPWDAWASFPGAVVAVQARHSVKGCEGPALRTGEIVRSLKDVDAQLENIPELKDDAVAVVVLSNRLLDLEGCEVKQLLESAENASRVSTLGVAGHKELSEGFMPHAMQRLAHVIARESR